MLSRISTHDLLASIERLASDPSMQNLDVRTLDAIKSLRSLMNDQRFQKSFQFAQKVKKSDEISFFRSLPIRVEKLIEYPCCCFFFLLRNLFVSHTIHYTRLEFVILRAKMHRREDVTYGSLWKKNS